MIVIGIMGDNFGGRVTSKDFWDDMGQPDWVDRCISYQRFRGHSYNFPEDDLAILNSGVPLFLVAFSRGCDVARQLSCQLPRGQIRGAILAEGPCFGIPCGTFPVWIGFNAESRRSHFPNGKQKPAARRAIERWSRSGRTVRGFTGTGRHLKRVDRPRTSYWGHGWDTTLNPRFEKIIEDYRDL